MTEKGLEEVPDASARLLSERVPNASGTTVLGGMEGSRPLLAEVQALVGHPTPANPGRTVLGMDRSRMQMLLAFLEKSAFNSMIEMSLYPLQVESVSPNQPPIWQLPPQSPQVIEMTLSIPEH